jgi:ABC-type bacteriocin/lantibiotic exporter with double-glycine peptidase domain
MNTTNQSLYKILNRLWVFIEPRRRVQLGCLFILMVFASLAEVVSIGAVLPFLSALTAPDVFFNHKYAQPFLQYLNISHPKDLLLPFTVCFSVAVVLSALMRLLLLWVQTRLSHNIGADFSLNIYRRTLYQPYAIHVSRNSSEVIAGISNKANSIIYSALFPVLNIISSFMMLVMILGALIFISPIVALVTIVGFGSIYGIIIMLTRKRLAQDSLRSSRETTQVIKALQEGLGGIRDVLIDGTQKTYCQIYRNADLPLRRAQANIVIVGGTPRFGIEALGMIFIAVIAYLQTTNSEQGGSMTVPVLGALALGAQRLLPVLQQAYYSWTTMKGGEVYLRDTLDLLDQPLPVYADEPVSDAIPFNTNISLDSVCFRYTPESPLVLDNLNLVIPKGARVGFIGVTGSGKSTVLDVIMGLLKPSSGNLMIDGVNISQKNYRSWQAHIAHVPQAIYLADATILENIAFGIPFEEIDYERVQEAASKAQIARSIESWDKQYLTKVGERGVRLSGGQRQRIGIARALYKKADVIVFDEATSALDNHTESEVMAAIENLGSDLTIIIVAHRLSTLKSCSRIFDIEAGTVTRIGSYNEIVEK